MNGLPAFGVPNAVNYQNEPEKAQAVVDFLFKRTVDAKKLIEELLYMLDLQEKVPWPDMLEKLSALASVMSTIQTSLRKSAMPSGMEDNGQFLRSHVMVPMRLQFEPDRQLQELSEGRIPSWNHDLVPESLRTRPTPEMEEQETLLNNERVHKGPEVIQRQIQSLNKNVDLLLQNLQNMDRGQVDHVAEKPMYNNEETQRLVRAIMCGDGLRRQQVLVPPPQAVQHQQPMGMIPGQQMPGIQMGMMQRPMPNMNITR